MPLTFPRKFVQGQKVGDVDVYGELFLWPDGYFQYMVHSRNSNAHTGVRINATFALLDEKRVLLGTFGMPVGQAWDVAPVGDLRAGRRYDELYGKVPADKMRQAGAVALLFRAQGAEADATGLQHLATTGSELVLCPIPD